MPLSASALEPLLRLAVVPGLGPARISALLRRFGSAERVLAASAAEVGALPGFGPGLVARVASAATDAGRARARAALETLRRVGAAAITPDDAAYPEAFHALPDPPFLLFCAGDLDLLHAPGVGVVGTREPTDYGRQVARSLSGDLALAGYAIVSGMAKGIDAAAHAAALEANGKTVGVLGQGIDRVYPAENAHLFGAVRERGLLISELAPGEDPAAGNFPRRNRLIAALSAGVLVVEMGEKSGARHTVEYALEMGKEVFAVPGPIGSPTSAGTNQLLKEGACLVTSSRDVLEALRGVGAADAPSPVAAPIASAPPPALAPPPELAPEEAGVFTALSPEPRHVDDLAVATGLAPSRVLAALLGLELKGAAESLPGKRFRRV
ncbi:MAG TPA: DNA-processing protein DprA [Longimicrobium sp.]|nr:DNA-processing protein DprA [Longimicrobium sp.]